MKVDLEHPSDWIKRHQEVWKACLWCVYKGFHKQVDLNRFNLTQTNLNGLLGVGKIMEGTMSWGSYVTRNIFEGCPWPWPLMFPFFASSLPWNKLLGTRTFSLHHVVPHIKPKAMDPVDRELKIQKPKEIPLHLHYLRNLIESLTSTQWNLHREDLTRWGSLQEWMNGRGGSLTWGREQGLSSGWEDSTCPIPVMWKYKKGLGKVGQLQ